MDEGKEMYNHSITIDHTTIRNDPSIPCATEAVNAATYPWLSWQYSPSLWCHRQVGWECPRCHKIHSPWVDGCDCKPDHILRSGSSNY
jgi:hypothetical protein